MKSKLFDECRHIYNTWFRSKSQNWTWKHKVKNTITCLFDIIGMGFYWNSDNWKLEKR